MTRRRKIFIYIIAAVLIYGVAQAIYSFYYARGTARLQAQADLFPKYGSQGQGSQFDLYVAGDSLGVGLGASSFENSIVGRVVSAVASHHRVTYTNVSVSGARLADVATQPLPAAKQDTIIVVASSNDLFHFTAGSAFSNSLRLALDRYTPLASQVIIIGPGAIYQARAVPIVLDPAYVLARPQYVHRLQEATSKYRNVTYIDNLAVDAAFKARYPTEITTPVDRFHLNDAGHQWWAELIIDRLQL